MDNIEKDIAQGYADFADDEGSIEEVETEENIVTENSTSFSFEETTNFSEMSDINRKLRTYFDGKIVRKDLTKSIKEGANVPVYVLEFLLGQYSCFRWSDNSSKSVLQYGKKDSWSCRFVGLCRF